MPLFVKILIILGIIYGGYKAMPYLSSAKESILESNRSVGGADMLDGNYKGEDRMGAIKKVVK